MAKVTHLMYNWQRFHFCLFIKFSYAAFYFRRILSTEIFAFKGSVDKDLIVILEKLFDEKSSIIQSWCDLMVTNSGNSSAHDTSILSTDEKSGDIGKN